MFAAPAYEGGPAKGTRSSRRRQRPVSSETVPQQPKAKRQRVPLADNTFHNPCPNPDAAPEMFEVKSDQIDLLGIKRDGLENGFSAPRKELSVRSKKPKAGERVSKGDGSVVLTTNSAYTVSKLPALPDRIRADTQNQQHGAVDSSMGYALCLTHTHALVWPYTSTIPSPETFVFALPYPSKHASDPLPLGSLVSPSAAADEPGLVVVMPVSGRIVFWESISSAATLGFIREQRTGVEDSIHGMFSGEHVTHIVNADSVGFILALSSGRLAHMNIRDGQGRPGISMQFLPNSPTNASSGFFGSLRNVLSASAVRGDIIAVKAAPPARLGERKLIAATSKGKLHSYKIRRGRNPEFGVEVDVRDEIINAIKGEDASINDPDDLFEVVDFAFVPRGLEKKYTDASGLNGSLAAEDDDSAQHLLLLMTVSQRKYQPRYALVEAVLAGGNCNIGMVRTLKTYQSPIDTKAPERPRLHLPRPGFVALVVFGRAVVVASLAALPDSPDAQLLQDSHSQSPVFEDVVDFKDADHMQIVGSGPEDPTSASVGPDELRHHRHHHKSKNPAVVLLVQGVGVVRVALPDVDQFASSEPPEVTAKSKLEQAVFYGTKSDNPLVFQGRRKLPFSDKAMGDAAMELSHEIVSSKSPFLVKIPASLEQNMTTRLDFLNRLILYLNNLRIKLDERTKWTLLYNAEKMAVAIWIWSKTEQFLVERPKAKVAKHRHLAGEIVCSINESQKTKAKQEIGEVDPVRHWFLNDIWRMEIFIAWCYQIVKQTYSDRNSDEDDLKRLMWEALTVVTGALRVAFDYRNSQCELYGLSTPVNPGGDAVTRPWTCHVLVIGKTRRLFDLCHKFLSIYYVEKKAIMDGNIISQLRTMYPTLAGHCLGVVKEYMIWAQGTGGETNTQDYAEASQVLSHTRDMILNLVEFDLWDEAIDLATQFQSWDALATILVRQIKEAELRAKLRTISVSEQAEFSAIKEAKKQQMGAFMDKYGKVFASHAYVQLLDICGTEEVLDFPYGNKDFKTDFLRERPELAKISWINDIEAEKDIEQAAETLLDLGISREQQVWNKKIELSLGKLALLAKECEAELEPESSVSSRQSRKEAKAVANLEKIDQELGIIKIQDALYSQIYPSIFDSVDATAAKDLAVRAHRGALAQEQAALNFIFEDAMGRLVKHEALTPMTLIDLLTLIQLQPSHYDEIGDQFFLALKVAKLGLQNESRTDAQKLIWRRCYIRDDWKAVNETNCRTDEEQLAMIGETATYRTLFSVLANDLDGDSVDMMEPKDVRGVFTENLDPRFNAFGEDYCATLLEAMNWEDKRLDLFMRKHQLQSRWFHPILEEAKRTMAHALHHETAEGAGQLGSTQSTLVGAEEAAEAHEKANGDAGIAGRLRSRRS